MSVFAPQATVITTCWTVAKGHQLPRDPVTGAAALPPSAAAAVGDPCGSRGPIATVNSCSQRSRYSITSSASDSKLSETFRPSAWQLSG